MVRKSLIANSGSGLSTMAKKAIIDVGTNTFHMLVIDENFNRVFSEKIPVKLGKGGLHAGKIAPDALQRGIDAFLHFQEKISELHVEETFAFATSAVRTTANGEEFVDLVFEKTGIKIKIISGDQEAEYIYKGVSNFVSLNQHNVLIMDIGGGSTEFIIGNKNTIAWKKSYPIGVSRIKETFSTSDPIEQNELEKLNEHINFMFSDLWQAIQDYLPQNFIGSSGTFESIASMISYQSLKEPDFSQPIEFSSTDFDRLHNHLLVTDLEKRLTIQGLSSMRAEYIVFGSLLVKAVLNKNTFQTITFSDHALKEGVLAELKEK